MKKFEDLDEQTQLEIKIFLLLLYIVALAYGIVAFLSWLFLKNSLLY